jgi:hypothetical protein
MMTFDEFRTRGHEVFARIPEDFREGVEGLEVMRRTVMHPTLPEVYTLGECLSDFYPSEFGGAGEVRSRVVLYYGSFQAVARDEEEWDWEDEIWETITHEIRHHLEHLASEDALGEMDYAVYQSFAMREGEPFDPHFYRFGERLEPGIFSVERDLFIEIEVGRRSAGHEHRVEGPLGTASFGIVLPDDPANIHFLRVTDPPFAVAGDLFVVVIWRKGVSERLADLLRRAPMQVEQAEITLGRNNASTA